MIINQIDVKQVNNDLKPYLVVMLHGYGSNGNDLISLAPYFQDDFPNFYFYSPNGHNECELNNYGFQWFSLADRSEGSIRNEMRKNASSIVQIIKTKLDELKLEEKNLILLGFSQGTMASLYLSLSGYISPACVIGFSGRLIIPDHFDKKSIDFPICLIHGTDDEIVDHSSLTHAEKFLKENLINTNIFSVQGLGHTIDLSGIEFAKNFIKTQINYKG